MIASAPHCEAATTNHSTADPVLITAQRWRSFISTNLTLNSTSMARPGRRKIVTEAEFHAEPASFILFLSTEFARSPSLQRNNPLPTTECRGSLAVKVRQTRQIIVPGCTVRTVWLAIGISVLRTLKTVYCTILCTTYLTTLFCHCAVRQLCHNIVVSCRAGPLMRCKHSH